MATKYVCDFCGREFDNEDEIRNGDIIYSDNSNDCEDNELFNTDEDICGFCVTEIESAVKQSIFEKIEQIRERDPKK